MRNKVITYTIMLMITGLLMVGGAFVPSAFTVTAADMNDSQIGDQLRQIEISAQQIESNSEELNALLRRPEASSVHSHSFELRMISEHVDDIGKMIPKLQSEKGLTDIQKDVIDRISGLTEAMAVQTNKAIQYLNDNPVRLKEGIPELAYTSRVAGIKHFAEHIDDLIDYAQANANLKDLRDQIG